MAVTVQQRGGWLCYRLYFDGWEDREPTKCKATDRNRKKLEHRAQTMSDLMDEGRFDYLEWFPQGKQAARYQPAPVPETPPVPTIGAYAAATWLPRMVPPNIRRALSQTYRGHLARHIRPAFGETPLDALTRGALLDFRGVLTRSAWEQGKALKMKTARDIIDGTFRALYRDARRDGLVTGDPFADLDWPDKIVPEADPFTAAERDTLCAYFRTKDPFWFPFVFTRFWTGMRPSEVRGLRCKDWDAKAGKLHIRRSRVLNEDNPPKTKKSKRSLTVLPTVRAVLQARGTRFQYSGSLTAGTAAIGGARSSATAQSGEARAFIDSDDPDVVLTSASGHDYRSSAVSVATTTTTSTLPPSATLHLVSGDSFLLKDSVVPKKRRAAFASSDTTFSTAGLDPRTGGAEVRLFGLNTGASDIWPLPAAGWTLKKGKYRYGDKAHAYGPVVSAIVANRHVALEAKGAAITYPLLGTAQQAIALALVLPAGPGNPTAAVCAEFPGTERKGVFRAAKAKAPVSCRAFR